MVPVEKLQELGAVVNFWRTRIDALSTQLSMLQELKAHGRPGGDRYASDRLLREIKKKSAENAEAARSLRVAERDLIDATDSRGHRVRTQSMSTESSRRTH